VLPTTITHKFASVKDQIDPHITPTLCVIGDVACDWECCVRLCVIGNVV